jgi:hypothetical protein
MTVHRLKSRLNVVARGHSLIARRPVSTHAACDRLADPLKPLTEKKVMTHLEENIVVSAKEKRNGVSSSPRAIGRTMYSTLENVICTDELDFSLYFPGS